MSATLHPADLSKETRYELGKLRMLHERAVATLWRSGKARGAEALEIASDAEITYHLDAQDAILELTNPEECDA